MAFTVFIIGGAVTLSDNLMQSKEKVIRRKKKTMFSS